MGGEHYHSEGVPLTERRRRPRISGPDGYGGSGLLAHEIRSRRANKFMTRHGHTMKGVILAPSPPPRKISGNFFWVVALLSTFLLALTSA